jgi:hypothetical protein
MTAGEEFLYFSAALVALIISFLLIWIGRRA